MFYLGTSGFSYRDWVGSFYPPGLPPREWLAFYSQEFNCLELNSTFYALPSPTALAAMARKTGPGFLFAVKAPQALTHGRQETPPLVETFLRVMEPLEEAGKLGCVLLQFPYSFPNSPENRDYLAKLAEGLKSLPLVVEFRHISWLRGSVFTWLKERGLGFCCVDEPHLSRLLPPVAEVTSPIAYVRFHGRNAVKWWQHQFAYERYDYTYSMEELAEWLPRIQKLRQQAEKTLIFANNHYRGQAIDTIRKLKPMLEPDVEKRGRLLFPLFGGGGS